MNVTDVEGRTEKHLESGRHILGARLAAGWGPQHDHVEWEKEAGGWGRARGQFTLALTVHSEQSSMGKGAAQEADGAPEMKSWSSAFQDSRIPLGWGEPSTGGPEVENG